MVAPRPKTWGRFYLTATEAGRMVFLFELYEKYTAGLFAEPKKRRP